jgi:hypothetical protein
MGAERRLDQDPRAPVSVTRVRRGRGGCWPRLCGELHGVRWASWEPLSDRTPASGPATRCGGCCFRPAPRPTASGAAPGAALRPHTALGPATRRAADAASGPRQPHGVKPLRSRSPTAHRPRDRRRGAGRMLLQARAPPHGFRSRPRSRSPAAHRRGEGRAGTRRLTQAGPSEFHGASGAPEESPSAPPPVSGVRTTSAADAGSDPAPGLAGQEPPEQPRLRRGRLAPRGVGASGRPGTAGNGRQETASGDGFPESRRARAGVFHRDVVRPLPGGPPPIENLGPLGTHILRANSVRSGPTFLLGSPHPRLLAVACTGERRRGGASSQSWRRKRSPR